VPGALVNIQGIAAGPPVGKPLELRIISDDLRAGNAFADDLYNYIGSINGVYNIESSVSVGVPQLVVDINDYKALTYGISPLQITNHLRGEINGVEAAVFNRDGNELDIVIRRDLELIDSLDKVENLYIPLPTGNMMPLSSLADIEELGGISGISRKDGERVITVSADLKEGTNINDVVNLIRDTYPESSIPVGVSLKYSGDVEGIEQNFGNLFQSMILAIFLVFIILTVQFKSIGQPFIILSTLPMAFIGVIWGLVITGNEFGFYAFMGLVALIGIAVNDAIVLIDYINYLRSQGLEVAEAIMEAGRTRFNPVLATTLTTISGVLPLAFKEAYYAQFSFALIFGLMVTTLLTLIFIPTIYSIFTRKTRKVATHD
jgi:HAE1 family hydrophobic/amphiphilic exporter-1